MSALADPWAPVPLEPQTALTAAGIFIAGILASAAGIGGGGLFVVVLMFSGLTPHESVPLSKAIICSGAIIAFASHARSRNPETGESLVDFSIVAAMVPFALVGTVLGVCLNPLTPPWVIMLGLTVLLSFMAMKTFTKGIEAHQAEKWTLARSQLVVYPQDWLPPIDVEMPEGERAGIVTPTSSGSDVDEGKGTSTHQGGVAEEGYLEGAGRQTGTMTVLVPLGVLLAVDIALSVLQQQLPDGKATSAMLGITFSVAGWACARALVPVSARRPLGFAGVALFAGVASGLFGIGGGLVISPFLLHAGVNPAVAVATSATCVVFTSASTTLQYMLQGRVLMQYAALYGAVSVLASMLGVRLVQKARDSGRGSTLILIVAAAVGLSAIAAIYEGLAQMGMLPGLGRGHSIHLGTA